jgi:hypothetical protein
MHPPRTPVPVLALILAFLVPVASRSQPLVLELDPGVVTLAFCDSAHVVGKCSFVHIDPPAIVGIGVVIRLDGQPYVLDWLGPGYHLDSGVILQAQGKARSQLAGQSWVEVYPELGRIHTSRSWRDADGDRRLSVKDTLTLEDGKVALIKDVRLNLRVSPADPEP